MIYLTNRDVLDQAFTQLQPYNPMSGSGQVVDPVAYAARIVLMSASEYLEYGKASTKHKGSVARLELALHMYLACYERGIE